MVTCLDNNGVRVILNPKASSILKSAGLNDDVVTLGDLNARKVALEQQTNQEFRNSCLACFAYQLGVSCHSTVRKVYIARDLGLIAQDANDLEKITTVVGVMQFSMPVLRSIGLGFLEQVDIPLATETFRLHFLRSEPYFYYNSVL